MHTPATMQQHARRTPRRTTMRLHALLLFGLLCMPVVSSPAAAQDDSTEQRVKAAFLYNFARFTNWNTLPDDTFNLCIIGDDPFGRHLNSIAGKTVHERTLIVTRIPADETGYDCQIVYFSGVTPAALLQQQAYLSGKPVLTVSSERDFIANNGMIGFRLEQGKIRFEINLTNANTAGLSISSKLLSLATYVQGADR